jgi:hypothetical protein
MIKAADAPFRPGDAGWRIKEETGAGLDRVIKLSLRRPLARPVAE